MQGGLEKPRNEAEKMVLAFYSEESDIRLTVCYCVTISWPLAPATPSRSTLWSIPGHLPSLSSLPQFFGDSGTLLLSHSYHLKRARGGRLLTHLLQPSIIPERSRRSSRASFQSSKICLGPEAESSTEPAFCRGKLGPGLVKEGVAGRGDIHPASLAAGNAEGP